MPNSTQEHFLGGGRSWVSLACSYKNTKPGSALELLLLVGFAPLLRLRAALQQDVQLQGCIILPYVPIHVPAEIRSICCHHQSKERSGQAPPCPVLAAILQIMRVLAPGGWGQSLCKQSSHSSPRLG